MTHNSIFLISNREFLKQINLEDKVFITAKYVEHKGDISLLIDDDCPIVALDQQSKELFYLKTRFSLETVKEFQSHSSDFYLLSVGTVLAINQDNILKFVLLKRDENALFAPNCLTEPAGRCSEHPLFSMQKEVNEEILLSANGIAYIVKSIHSEKDCNYDRYLFDVKTNQIKDVAKDKNIQTIELLECELLNSSFDFIVSLTVVYPDGVEISYFNGPHYIDHTNKTVEIREALVLPGYLLNPTVIDGEKYGRLSGFYSLEEVVNSDKTRYLQYFCNKFLKIDI